MEQKHVDLNAFGGVVAKLAKERITEKLESTSKNGTVFIHFPPNGAAQVF